MCNNQYVESMQEMERYESGSGQGLILQSLCCLVKDNYVYLKSCGRVKEF